MIPEKRTPEHVDHVLHIAVLTGQPVEIRDDELAEYKIRHDPFARFLAMQAATVRLMAEVEKWARDAAAAVPAPEIEIEIEGLTLAELRLHDLAVAQDRVKGWSGPGDRQAELAETVRGWIK